MKTILQVSIFFLLLTQIFNAQWFWRNPLPQGNIIYEVKLVSKVGWIVGGDGTVLKATDSGIYGGGYIIYRTFQG